MFYAVGGRMTEKLIYPGEKILDLKSTLKWRESLRPASRKLVVTNGCFDILHRGHVEYLYRARLEGDALLVLMNSDKSVKAIKGPSRPVVSELDRAFVLAGLSVVDKILIFGDPRCTGLIEKVKPDIYVKGGDYTLETLNPEEKRALTAVGAEIRFISFVEGFSTTKLISGTKCKTE